MREFFSDRAFIQSKITKLSKLVLIIALLIFFLPLIVLPFFNHPTTDDYFCGYNLHNKNFWQYQVFIYKNWGGRFAATFAGSLFAYHDFLYSHYYFHSLLFLVLDFFSILFLVNTFNKYFLKGKYSFQKRSLFSFLFLALEICCLPQGSTFIFWFSSAITYHLPIILIQTELALLGLYFYSTNKSVKLACSILLPIFVFIIIGFNEFFVVAELAIIIMIFYFDSRKTSSLILKILGSISFLASSALIIFSPGNRVRISEVASKKIYVGLGSVAYHSFETLWSICRNPLFWFIGLFIFLYASRHKETLAADANIKKISGHKWLFLISAFIFLVAAVALPVVLLKGGIIPDRYLNAVAYLMVLLLLFYFFIAGISLDFKIEQRCSFKKHFLIYFFLSAGLVFNNYIFDAYKSIIIAPTYSTILSQRENTFKKAAETGKIATVNDYNTAVSRLIQTKYKSGTATFQQLIQQEPPLLFFKDDLTDIYTIDVIKKYYALNHIIVESSNH